MEIMESLGMLMAGFAALLNPTCITLMIGGTIIGIVFGSIPGLTATMAVALFLPITYGMTPIEGMTLLISLYIGGMSGGLISAILINIPGTPASIATCFDGHPMTEKGEGAKALGLAIFTSFVGTILSFIALAFIAPPLAKFALKFGPYEYFSIAIFSLTMISALSAGSMVKGLIAGVLGFMVATIGVAPLDAVPRFTFGFRALNSGFDILTILIGVFALGEILSMSEKIRDERATIIQVSMKGIKGFGFSIKEYIGQTVNILRSALIGISIGILPGIGGSTANIVAYAVAKNQSKHPEKFGTGIIDGVVASETSNNACIGGALIPLLTLGIPGDMVTAILLGGLMIHGLTPGPMLFQSNADIVYGIFAIVFLASIAMLIIEFFGLRLFVKLLKIPKHILFPIIFVLCVVGAFGVNNRMFDVWGVLAFGLLGYAFIKFKVSFPPFILGFILGPMAETAFRRGVMLSQGSYLPFITEPISGFFIICAALSVCWTAYTNINRTMNAKKIAA